MKAIVPVIITAVVVPVLLAIWQRRYTERPSEWESFLMYAVPWCIAVVGMVGFLFLGWTLGDSLPMKLLTVGLYVLCWSGTLLFEGMMDRMEAATKPRDQSPTRGVQAEDC